MEDFIEEDVRFNFIPGRCNVCVLQHRLPFFDEHMPLELRTCSGCRLIAYCSVEHQSQDRAAHREFCKAVGDILRSDSLQHLADINGPIRDAASLQQFQSACSRAMWRVAIGLGRSLEMHEMCMISYPRICSICYSYDLGALQPCPDCKTTYFCRAVDGSMKHTADEMEAVHSASECEQLRIFSHMIIVVQDGTIGPDLWQMEPLTMNTTAFEEAFPGDSFALLKHSTGRCVRESPQTSAELVEFAGVGNFTYIATMAAALRRSNVLNESPPAATLNIHIIGTCTEVVLFTADECWMLLYYMPERIESIELHFIGLNLPEGLDGEVREHSYANGRRRIVCRYLRECYGTGDRAVELCAPVLCIAYNAGLNEFAAAHPNDDNDDANPWQPALQRVLRVGGYFARTAYVADELHADGQILQQAAAKLNRRLTLEWGPGRNPYRDCRPYRNPINACTFTDTVFKDTAIPPTESVYFVNGYVEVVKIHTDSCD